MQTRRDTIPIGWPRQSYDVLDADVELLVRLRRYCGFAHRKMAAVMLEAKDGRPRNPMRIRKRDWGYYWAVSRRVDRELGYNITDFRNAETEESQRLLAGCLKAHWNSLGKMGKRKVQG